MAIPAVERTWMRGASVLQTWLVLVASRGSFQQQPGENTAAQHRRQAEADSMAGFLFQRALLKPTWRGWGVLIVAFLFPTKEGLQACWHI